MRRFIFPFALSLCILAVASHHAAAKDTWISVRTKNFFLVGNTSEKEIRRVGLKLEQFREVFTHLFSNMRFNTPVPTTVVVFRSHSSFAPFKTRANTAGYFQPGHDVNYITLTTETGSAQDPFSIIFHEYTHLLVNNNLDNAPLWFNEGLAEYYCSFEISDDQKIMLGAPIGHHVFLLRQSKMLPLKTLFEVDDKSAHYNETNKTSIFYAQSWALMHYLIIGKAGRGDQLSKFLALRKSNMPLEEAFEKAFETTFEDMERELRSYVKQDRYNVIRANLKQKIELDTTAEAATLTEAEAQAYLGDLLLHGRRQEAHKYLEKALKLDPNLAMAHASLGMAYFREGKAKEAHASLERAVAANSQNYLAHYYYAYTLSRPPADDAPAINEYSPELAAKIREHLQKAIALRPDFPESYNLLGFVSLITGEGIDEAIVSLKHVVSSSPGLHELTYMLAQLYLRKDDYKLAQQVLEQVASSNAPPQLRQHAELLLTEIKKLEQQRAEYETRRSRGNSTTTYGPDGKQTIEQANDPSFYLREVLRAPEKDEIQLQGKLVAIECEAKGIVFVVETASGTLRLRTENFDSIEFTTYDPSVQGNISCGARKPQNSVVVCYLPNSDKRGKADGVLKSIEFVPSDFKLKP
jgi:tetratricopeptide (TPR) repeat protein